MDSLTGLYISYKIIKLLSKPFSEWKAFELGLIDETGKLLRKPKSAAEKKVFGVFERVIWNIKKIAVRLTGHSKAAAMFSALYALKEYVSDEEYVMVENHLRKMDKDFNQLILERNEKRQALMESL